MASISWDTPVSGDWTTADDWNTGTVPGAGDNAIIGIGGFYTVSLTTSIAVGSIAISDPGATLDIVDPGGTDTVTAGLSNSGTLLVDSGGGEGGSTLTIGGMLYNPGTVVIGNTALSASTSVTAAALSNTGALTVQGNSGSGTADQATLDITGAAPATATGSTRIGGDALLEFKSGGIGAIAGGAFFELDGAQARVSIGAGTTNSGLSKLSSNAGTFLLRGNSNLGAGAPVVTTTVGFVNNGTLWVDYYGGDGGTSLTIGGALYNRETVVIGNTALSASTSVTAVALSNTGALTVQGNSGSGTADQATLDITGAAPATATGSTRIGGDALLEFKSGGIGAIAGGAFFELDGAQARVSIGAGTTNSGLSKLSSNAGTFLLRGNSNLGAGAPVVTTTVGFVNNGTLWVDYYGGDGGTSLTIGGALYNRETVVIGNTTLSASTSVTAAALSNTGALTVQGNSGSGTADQATLDITGAAPATATGSTRIGGDALLEFKSGGIGAIAGGAFFELDGAQARVSIGAGTTNSGLSKLSSNAGTFLLRGNSNLGAGAPVVTTTVGFVNNGTLWVDYYGGDGGTSLTIGGALYNRETVVIGNTALSASTSVTAVALSNSGSLSLFGNAGQIAEFVVNGAATNTGAVDIGASAELALGAHAYVQTAGTTNVGGILAAAAVDVYGGLVDFTAALTEGDGTGALNVFAGGTLEFGAGVAAGHTVTFAASTGTLELGAPATVAATIAGFSGTDVIDLLNSTVTSLVYAGSSSSGTLTASDVGVTVATLLFSGDYSTTSFTFASDGHGGTDIVLTQPNPVIEWSNASGGSWTAGSNWTGGIVPGSTNNAVIALGGSYTVSLTTAIAVNSIDITDTNALLSIAAPAQTDSVGANLVNAGTVYVDVGGGAGGTTVSVGGELANSGSLYIGNGSLSAATTVTAASLSNTGGIYLTGNYNGAADQTVLDIAGAAGFGMAGVVTGTVQLNGYALLEFGSGSLTTIAAGATLNLETGQSPNGGYIADKGTLTSNSALTGLASNAGTFDLSFGATVTTKSGTAFVNTGTVDIDDYAGSPGGSGFHIGGVLTNLGTMYVGNGNITAATAMSATGLANSGTIDLQGNNGGGTLATLDITGAAGFGTAGVVTGTINLYGDSLLEFASGTITTIASGAQLNLQTGIGHVADAGSLTSNSALTGLASNAGTFDLAFGATVTTKSGTAFVNTGTVDIDDYAGSPGGSGFHIGGVLTNLGTMYVGNGNITAATAMSATGLANSGTIDLQGNNGGGTLATLDITGAAGFGTAGVVTGTINLYGDALLEFASGTIVTIASGAQLNLQTGIGHVADAGSLTSNSALVGLASNAGTFDLAFGATVTTKSGTAFVNTGTVDIDDYAGSPGGSSFDIGGVLTNLGTMYVGNGNMTVSDGVSAASLVNAGTINLQGNNGGGTLATLDITGAAGFGTAGVVTGTVNLYGDALLEFASGTIVTIASGAQLNLQTGIGHVADAGSLTSNSALVGLASNAGTFDLAFGATVTTKSGTAFVNTGTVDIDDYAGSPGGSRFDIGGVLTNSGTMYVGNGNMTVSDGVSAASLVNAGTINLAGNNSDNGALAVLTIAGAAGSGSAGLLTGTVNLTGQSLLEFASGTITTIASGATLNIQTGIGYVADLGSITSNSALTGLASNAGTFDLAYGATVTTTSGTGFVNTGTVDIDDYAGSPGGSSLHIGGTLTNIGTVYVGNGGMTVSDGVSAAGLDNSGTINLYGDPTAQGTLSVSGAGSNTGTVNINDSAVLDDSETYSQDAGTTTVLGTLNATDIDVLGGVLQGAGTIGGPVDNSGGTVLAGTNSTPGTLTINGTYSQSGEGILEALLNGTGSGQFGTLAATEAALTGGTLDAQVNFTLAAGDTFTVLTFTPGTQPGFFGAVAANGTVGAATYVDLAGGLSLGVVYNLSAGTIDLEVFATPASNADAWVGGSGSWSTAADWTEGVPNPTSNVTIGETGSGSVTLNETDTVDSLTIDSGNSLTFAANEALAVGDGFAILSGGRLTMIAAGDRLAIGGTDSDAGTMSIGSGDMLDVVGDLTVSGDLALSNSTINGTGTLTIASGGTLSGTGTLDTTVANSGKISGGPTVGGGGYLYNAPGGMITNAGTALFGVSGTAASVITNDGTIDGTGTAGVGIAFSGPVGSTLTNAGTIIGAGGTAVSFGAGNDLLILDPGDVFTGKVVGGAGSNAIELAGTTLGSLAGLGTNFVDFDDVTVATAADWQLTGANTIAAGETLAGTGTLSDAGALTNQGSIGITLTLIGSGSLTNAASGNVSDPGTAIYGTDTSVGVINSGTVTSTDDTGVSLGSGGFVHNGTAAVTTATIAGYHYGVRIGGSSGSVINLGDIASAGGVGVSIENGTVANGLSTSTAADIAGYLTGVLLYGTTGKVTNFATITADGLLGTGVYLDGTGSSLSNAGRIESSGIAGVGGTGGTLSNSGSITATGVISDGVFFTGDGGAITNGASALIEGDTAGIYLGGGGWSVTNSGVIEGSAGTGVSAADDSAAITITNFGTITGAGGTAIAFGSGNDRLIEETGAVVNGIVTGGAGNDVFEFTISSLTATDTIVGGGGTDELLMTTAGTVAASRVSGVETYVLANGGANTLTLTNANFVGVTGASIMVDDGNDGNTVNASAVTGSNRIVVMGGVGKEVLTGGAGNDIFEFTAADLAATDTITGGGGTDELLMTSAGTVAAGGVSGVEVYHLANGGANTLTLTNANFAGVTGASITVDDGNDGNTINASAVTGSNRIVVVAGVGKEVLTGGAGNDIFEFSAANLKATDTVAGGGGTDELLMTTAGTVAASGVSGVEIYKLANGGANTLTLTNANFAGTTGASITVEDGNDGNTVNASAVTGSNRIVVVAGAGNDTVTSAQGNNIFDFDQGAGTLNITNAFTGGTAAHGDLDFGTGITDQNLWFVQSGNNLVAELIGTAEQATVNSWFGTNASAKLSEIEAGGLKLDSQVAQLVSAMATYSADNPGFNPTASGAVMPTDTTLQNAIASAWHS